MMTNDVQNSFVDATLSHEQVIADGRMSFHDVHLGLRQRPGLIQDRRGNMRLPEIVDEGGL